MKKIISLAVTAMMITAGAAAADFGGKKFYINPGHGGHDSDDRPTALPLGVEMFYESDGNLDRGLHLRDFFQANNASVKMSRTTNYSSDDLALSTIAANSNSYGGYFMSLHSNGANASANYVVSFYRGNTSGAQVVSGAKAMAEKVSAWHDNNHLTNLTYTTPRAMSDYSFYGYNLGVLRTNSRPGYLVETFFHDYRPDGLRMKSTVFNKYTAWQILRAAMDTPGASGTLSSCIIGDVRDLNKGCGYSNYTARGRDSYLAINGATVNLYNSSGTRLQTMQTDNCCNGVYGFFGLSAGTYQVEVVKNGYATQRKTVTVSANASAKQLFNLVEGVSSGITTSKESLDFGTVTIGQNKTLSFNVTAAGLSSDISLTCDNPQVTVSPATVSRNASSAQVSVTYTPSAAGAFSAKVKLSSGSTTATVPLSATAVNPPLTFSEGWNFSEKSGKSPQWLPEAGWSALRNICFGDGKLYVVNPSQCEILVVKAQSGELLTKLDMTGVETGTFKVMDVKYVGGKVLACNLAGAATVPIKVYVWDTDYSKPRCLLSTTERDGLTRMGDTFDYEGTLDDGKLIFCGGGTNEANKVIIYDVAGGNVNATPRSIATAIDDKTPLIMGISPRAVSETGDRYWVMGQNYSPTLIQSDGLARASVNTAALDGDVAGNDFAIFNYKGTSYALATTYTPKASSSSGATLTEGKAVLLDGTDGWAAAAQIGKYPSAGMGTTRNTNFSTSCAVAVNGNDGVEFWVFVSNQGIAYFKTGTVPVYTYQEAPVPTINVSPASVSFREVYAHRTATKTLNVTGSLLEGDITLELAGADSELFSLSTDIIPMADGAAEIEISYTPTSEGVHTASVTLASPGAKTVTVNLSGECVPKTVFNDEINELKQEWIYSTGTGNLASASEWFTAAHPGSRDMCVADGKLYLLNSGSGDPTVHILNAYTGQRIGSLNTSGITGGTFKLASIRSLGGTVVGCNFASGSATQPLKVYKWDNDNSAPTELLNTGDFGGVGTNPGLGRQMSVDGTMADGRLIFSDGARVVVYAVKNGVASTTPSVITLSEATALNCAQTVQFEDDGSFWFNNTHCAPTRFSATGSKIETLPSAAIGGSRGTSGNIFDFGSHRYGAFVTTLGTGWGSGALRLVDLTAGVADATPLLTYPENGLGTASWGTNGTTALSHELADDGTKLHAWVMVPQQGIAMYSYTGRTTVGVETVAAAAHAAMTVTVDGGTLRVDGIDARTVTLYSTAGAAVATASGREVEIGTMRGIYIVAAVDATGLTHTAKVALR